MLLAEELPQNAGLADGYLETVALERVEAAQTVAEGNEVSGQAVAVVEATGHPGRGTEDHRGRRGRAKGGPRPRRLTIRNECWEMLRKEAAEQLIELISVVCRDVRSAEA